MKADRHIGILSILLQKDKVTASELAEKFEVSRRTIIRDIEDISKAGIPIATSQGQGGGISIMDGFRIDRTLLTSSDMKAILAGLNGLDSISADSSFRRLMDKLSADNSPLSPDSHIIIDLSSWDKSAVSDKIKIIRKAMESGSIISFTYYSPSGESSREIEPYHLVFQWSSWYVWGYCLKRRDFRMFKLTRLTDLVCTDRKCAEREIPEYVCDKLNHTHGEICVKVRFNSSVKWRIIDEFGIELPKYDESGNILLDFTWSDIESLYNYILTFGDKAEIISPDNIRNEYIGYLKKILGRYET